MCTPNFGVIKYSYIQAIVPAIVCRFCWLVCEQKIFKIRAKTVLKINGPWKRRDTSKWKLVAQGYGLTRWLIGGAGGPNLHRYTEKEGKYYGVKRERVVFSSMRVRSTESRVVPWYQYQESNQLLVIQKIEKTESNTHI